MRKSRFCIRIFLGYIMICSQLLSGCTSDADSILNKLKIRKNGDGSGIVTSSSEGINCGDDCFQFYAKNKKVTLTTTADEYSEFTGWSGGGCSGTGVCTVKIIDSETVTATFQRLKSLHIEKIGDGSGIVESALIGIDDCGEDCGIFYSHGTQVTLRATADEGSEFIGWSGGGCSGIGDCTVVLDQSQTVTAIFNKSPSILYKTRGNGIIIEILDDEYKWYEVTNKSLFSMAEGTIIDDMINYNGCEIETLDYLLSMSDRIDNLPERDITSFTDDPIVNFEVFWTIFDEYYALFDLANLDWKTVYSVTRPKITPDTTDDELWEIFVKMIAPLNDGHTMLLDFDGMREAYSRPIKTAPSYWMMENLNTYVEVIASYLDSFSIEENITGNGNILHGTIDDRVGYINILSYEGYAEDSPSMEEFSILSMMCGYSNDLEVFPDIIDKLFSGFSEMEALIIDLRFNMGGSGDLVLEFMSRLITEKQLAYSYQVRFGDYDEFDNSVLKYIEPCGIPFLNKPIIVLTSNNTVSAGDFQAMLLKSLPNVTVMGETTFGIFSEGIPKSLPNGWIVTLSTQRLYSKTGEFFEQIGVSPHVEVLPDADGLIKSHDNMLEAALNNIR